MVNFFNASFSIDYKAFLVDDEVFDYASLLSDEIPPEVALQILSKPPQDLQRRQWAIDNAAELVIRFHIPELPAWMGYAHSQFRAEYLFCTPEALLEELSKNLQDPELLDRLSSDHCVNENGETAFHYACKWDHEDRFKLIELLIRELYGCCKKDDEGRHPFDLIPDSMKGPLIDLLCEIPHPETPQGYGHRLVADTLWIDELIQLENLNFALLYAERRPHSLVHIDFHNESTIKENGTFVNGNFTSCLSHLFERNLPFEKIIPFLDIWKDKMTGCTGLNPSIFIVCSTPKYTKKIFNTYETAGKIDDSQITPLQQSLKMFEGVPPRLPMPYMNFLCLCSEAFAISNGTEGNFEPVSYLLASIKYKNNTGLIKQLENDHQDEKLKCWLIFVRRILSTKDPKIKVYFKDLIYHFANAIFSSFDDNVEQFAYRIDRILETTKEFGSHENTKCLREIFETHVTNDFSNKDIKKYLLFRCPSLYSSIPQNLRDIIINSHAVEDFSSPGFSSMTPHQKIAYLELTLPLYPQESRQKVLQAACPFSEANKALNEYAISQGMTTVNLGNQIFTDKNYASVSTWIDSGGHFPEQFNDVSWDEETCANALTLIKLSPYFKEHFRKFFNPYLGNVKKYGNLLLDLVIASDQTIVQSFFYPYKNGALFQTIFEHRGYLLIEKQQINPEKLTSRQKNCKKKTQMVFKQLCEQNKNEVNIRNISVKTTYSEGCFYILATFNDESITETIKLNVFFTEEGHNSLLQRLTEKLIETANAKKAIPRDLQQPLDSNTSPLSDQNFPVSHHNGLFSYVEFNHSPDSTAYYLTFRQGVKPQRNAMLLSPESVDTRVIKKYIAYIKSKNSELQQKFYEDLKEIFPESNGNPNVFAFKSKRFDRSTIKKTIEYYIALLTKSPINLKKPSNIDKHFLLQLSQRQEFKELYENELKRKADLERELVDLKQQYHTTWSPITTSSSNSRKRTISFDHGSSNKSQRTYDESSSTNRVSMLTILKLEKELETLNDALKDNRLVIEYAKNQGYFYYNHETNKYFYTPKGAFLKEKLRGVISIIPPPPEVHHPARSISSSSSRQVVDDDVFPNTIINISSDAASSCEPSTFFKERFRNIKYRSGKIESLDYQHSTIPQIALFICARADETGALDIDHHAQMNLMTLSEGYSTKFRRAGSNKEFLSHLRACPDKSIGNLWLSAHASPSVMIWGDSGMNDNTLIPGDEPAIDDELKSVLLKKLAPGANIFLEACSTGGVHEKMLPNIADYFAGLVPGHEVFAPKIDLQKTGKDASEIIVESIYPLRCRIMQHEIDQTYRIRR